MRPPSSPVARTSKCVSYATVGVGVLCFFGFISVLVELDFAEKFLRTDNDVEQAHEHQYIKEAEVFSSLNDTAYVFLGLGATAHQRNCPAAIESLVRYGGWDGRIYMITDHANCFDVEQIVENAGMRPENFHMITLTEDFGGGGLDVFNPKVGFSRNRLRSKAMKTQLFDLIEDPSIQVLAYVDCDILFGVEGCARDYVSGGVPWEERKIRFSRVLVDPGSGKLLNIHTGSIMMHRKHSREVLQRWYDRINTGVDDMDRLGYMAEYDILQKQIDSHQRNSSNSNSTGNSTVVRPVATNLRTAADARRAHAGYGSVDNTIPSILNRQVVENVMMPAEQIMYNASTGDITRYEVFVNPDSQDTPCMLHVSKARCDQFGRAAVQGVVDRYRLRTYRTGELYCPNPLVAPILYGWFPLSYLPFCPKIEMFH
jgi:hypothetical protein